MRAVGILSIVAVTLSVWACSSGNSGGGGAGGGGGGGGGGGAGSDGGANSADSGAKSTVALLNNASVSQTCQTCLANASGNDCASLSKICAGDTTCTALNTCVNNCTNLNAGCITNCENTASKNTGIEWTDWFGCACNDCTTQCAGSAGSNGSLCSGGTGGGGGGGTPVNGTCVLDTTDGDCGAGQREFDCAGSDNPVGDGLSNGCGQAMTFGGSNDSFYCCN